MIKLVGYFSLLLVSTNLFAQTCTTVDLSAEGNVLHPLTASHQNGLGICHAEQLQRMLKAKLPNNPELARVSLAMEEKQQRDRALPNPKAIRWMSGPDKVGGLYFDAGNSCEAFNLIKGKSICLAKDSQLEKLSTQNPDNQYKILSALALFFDQKSKQLFNEFPQSEVLKSLQDEYARARVMCAIDPKIENDFYEIYKKEYFLHSALEKYPVFEAKDYLGKSVKTYLNNIFPYLNSPKVKSVELKMKRDALIKAYRAQEKCSEERIMEWKNPNCPIFNRNFSDVFNLSSLGLSYKDFYRMLSLTDKNRDQYFTQALRCSGKKILIPGNLTCTNTNLPSMYLASKTEEEYVNKFSAQVIKTLETKTPLGISVCTRFFKRPDLKTYTDLKEFSCGKKDAPSYQNGEGSHAITIIGKRCINGETQFLVHNSWGKGCGYYHSSLECNKQGGFWVSAKTLALNSRTLSVLK